MLASHSLAVLTARAATPPQTTTLRSRLVGRRLMLTIGFVMIARRSALTAAACLRTPRCPTAPTGPIPSAAVVRARPSPRCRPRVGMPARADPHSVQRQLADEAAPPCARTLSAAVCCSERHCAAVAEMLTGIAALATSGHVPPCRLMCVVHAPLTVHVE